MFKKLEQVIVDTRDHKSIFSLIFFDYKKNNWINKIVTENSNQPFTVGRS
ncbi:hypothetical protein Ppb6_03414 [Photorhabdus australis subsp. thailandensis]|uniref:Uncharacterized protein n=1 Tax=Photorhabdus australis subsp. thailandensis TaxID=2805096 RepID=A0A1C0U0G3_9GAMM|nr:hypothetical protein Ppb6_03414 [Photorhabdus australis subsp. thailandensis]